MSEATIIAHVDPRMLRWARRRCGLTLAKAAKRRRVRVDRIRAWEAGEPITVTQLRRLAETYRVPMAVLFMSKPPRRRKAGGAK